MRQKTNARVIKQRERERECLELRLAGATYDQISETLGMSKNGAWKAVSRAITEITREPAERVRKLELSRLDALQTELWAKARKGDGPAVDRILKIMERRAKILGLDAPVSLKLEDAVAQVLDVVAAVCSPEQYEAILAAIARLGGEEPTGAGPEGEDAEERGATH